MAENLGEQLRTLATTANERQTRQLAAADAADKNTRDLSPDELEEVVSGFVRQNFGWALMNVVDDARRNARQGAWSSRTTWGFDGQSDDPELALNLAKWRGLRDKVIDHLSGLGVVASEIDTRSGHHFTGSSDPSEPAEWRPSSYRVIGVKTSWKEPTPQTEGANPGDTTVTEVMDRVVADQWLNQGQASPL